MASQASIQTHAGPSTNTTQQSSTSCTDQTNKRTQTDSEVINDNQHSEDFMGQLWDGVFLTQRQATVSIADQVRIQVEEAQARFASKMNNDPDDGYSSDEEGAAGADDVRILESSLGLVDDEHTPNEAGRSSSLKKLPVKDYHEDPISDDEVEEAIPIDPTTELTTSLSPTCERAAERAGYKFADEGAIYEEESVSLTDTRLEKQAVKDEGGILKLVEYTLRKEIALYKTIDGADEVLLSSIAYLIAIETHPEILKVAMTGGWAYGNLNNTKLKKVLQRLKDRASHCKHPFLYVNEIADESGQSLTPNQLLVVVSIAEEYYKGEDPLKADAIDRIRAPHPSTAEKANPGFRKYLWNTAKQQVSSSRIFRGLQFCTNLRERLAGISPEKMDEPLDVPLIEIGHTNDVPLTFANHRNHTSSNPIMNLFEAIIHLEWPGQFTLWQFVIHCCCKPNRVALGMVLFARLCEGYSFNAGGFGRYPAYVSIASAYDDDYDGWVETEEWVVKSMHANETDAAEKRQWKLNIDRLEARRAADIHDIAVMQEEIKRGEEELALRAAVQEGPVIDQEALDEALDEFYEIVLRMGGMGDGSVDDPDQ